MDKMHVCRWRCVCDSDLEQEAEEVGQGYGGQAKHPEKDSDRTKSLSGVLRQVEGSEANDDACGAQQDSPSQLAGTDVSMSIIAALQHQLLCCQACPASLKGMEVCQSTFCEVLHDCSHCQIHHGLSRSSRLRSTHLLKIVTPPQNAPATAREDTARSQTKLPSHRAVAGAPASLCRCLEPDEASATGHRMKPAASTAAVVVMPTTVKRVPVQVQVHNAAATE